MSLLGGSACGPEFREPAELVERCGTTEPVQLLRLGPREVVYAGSNSVARHEDRWLIGVREHDTGTYPPTNEAPNINEIGSRIISVDECGEDSFVAVEGFAEVFPPTAPDEPWLACADGGSLYRIDPDGQRAPQFLVVATTCWFVRAGPSIVTLRERSLVRVDTHGGEPSIVVLESGINGWSPANEEGTIGSLRAQLSLVSNDARELVEIEHATGARRVLRTGVGGFESPVPGRYLVWTPDEIVDGASWPFLRRWLLWDRDTDVEIAIADGAERDAVLGPGALMIYGALGADDWSATTELLLLPERRSVVLEGAWSVDGGLADGTRFLQRMGEDGGGLFVLEPDSDMPTRLADDFAEYGWITSDGEYRRLVDRSEPGASSSEQTQEIVGYRGPDFTASTVVRDVYAPLELPGDRWLTVREHTGDNHGELVVVDGSTGELRFVDRDVFMDLGYMPAPVAFTPAPPIHEGPLVYAVRDEDFERAGIWIAEVMR